jgi:hypothetical protein
VHVPQDSRALNARSVRTNTADVDAVVERDEKGCLGSRRRHTR